MPFRRLGKCEAGPLRYLRNNSRYLISGGFVGRLKMVCQGLYGVVMNLLLLTILVFVAVAVTDCFPMADELREASASFDADYDIQATALKTTELKGASKRYGVPWTMSQTLAIVGASWLVLVILLPLVEKLGRTSNAMFRFRKRYSELCVAGFALVVVLLMADTIPAAPYVFLVVSSEL